jgi:hypothetical protein
MAIDLSNPLEWNAVYKKNLVSANSKTSLNSISFTTSHHQLVIGIQVPNKPTWRWGGYLTEQVAALPSSTAQLFTALIAVKSYRLTCLQYQAIDLDPAIPLPFVCTISFPRHFRECNVEVYARNDP